MSHAVIQVENLGKRYTLGPGGPSNERYTALRDVIAQKARSLFRPQKPLTLNSQLSTSSSPSEFWALKDVSFDIKQGEVVGIIGRNGAGKSTLLKILSRITDPTEGRIKIKGRVASLLEVGTGFHPELTGRENIYLNGAILGMTRAEIKAKFDEIVAFAEVEKFLDTPVKRYSSGMYVRLAFAVAAHLEPEILIVDEVLAVGDAEFQKKCLGKMKNISGYGRTVIFVSHNMAAIKQLCSRSILLKDGNVSFQGQTEQAISWYLKQNSILAAPRTIDIEKQVQFLEWRVDQQEAGKLYACESRETCTFVFTVICNVPEKAVNFGFLLRSIAEEIIIGNYSKDEMQSEINLTLGVNAINITTRLPIRAGIYRLDICVVDSSGETLDQWLPPNPLEILPGKITLLGEQWQGIVNESIQYHHTKPSEVITSLS